MTEPAVRVSHLSKRYQIGHRQPYKRFTETLMTAVSHPFGRKSPAENETLWALNDISMEINPGEVVGIIGRNGAGKSTLLKIISRITPPTSGTIEMRGRVSSLLEVGVGFHPELTARENVYLNGSILGMKKFEVARKFDEIMAFADVEKFIDTPVKHLSSGMYMRLAFSVAAHLEPEILIVDEVLAVGDASFQRKCLNKMQDVSEAGRTVIFVSHNMASITRLCPKAILLDAGRLVEAGPAHTVVAHYLQSGLGTAAQREWQDLATAPGNEISRLRAVRVRNHSGTVADAVDIRQPIKIEMEYQVLSAGHILTPNLHFYSEEGICAFVTGDVSLASRRSPKLPGLYKSSVTLPGNFFSEGTMIVHAALSTMDPVRVHFFEKDAVAFHVTDSLDGDSARGDYGGHVIGVVRPLLDWDTKLVPASADVVPAPFPAGDVS